ncbi:MAG: carboxypeptidase regulatory-like domain-containing protein, partial [Blastocatellia bacterium]|nr:carboxypeptidase regulatory-like domain-containing protein [Blastocatellia bacterium]
MKIRAFHLFVLLCSLMAAGMAQTSRGTVSGTVTDSTGAVISGANVALTNTATTVSRSTVANSEGFYRFDAVDLGAYTLKVTASGFGAVVKSNIAVSAGLTSTVDAQLAPGAQEVSVDVTAETGALLQTEAPVRGGAIDATRITELPIATRNPVSLALTLPGVSTNRFGFGVATFSVNGGRGRSNNFLIDGTENNDISIAGQGFQIKNPDAVQEVSVQTSNYDAEFGRAGGAVVNTITKAGTNRFHGTASWQYDSTRDDALTNTQSLDPSLKQRGYPPYGTEHIFAGTIGGPVKLPGLYDGKDRTFFFGAYQNQRQASNKVTSVLVPTAAGRTALRTLFAAGANPRVDQLLAVTDGVIGIANPTRFALGNNRPDIEFGQAVTAFAQTYVEPQYQVRIDHKVSDRSQLSGRYLFADQFDPVAGATLGLPGFTTSQSNRFQNFLLSETHVFSPSLTNELRLSYNRIALAFPFDPPNALAQTLPSISIAGITNAQGIGWNFGVQTNLPQGRIANNYVIQDTMTYVRANHTFRFGFDLLQQRSRQFAPINERGSLTYSAGGGFTGLANYIDDFGGAGPGGGSANRDFGSPGYYPELFRQAYFFQDRWRVNDSLTLTLGGRYENFGNPVNSIRTAAFTGLFNVDPVTLQGPYSQPSKVRDDNNNWAPTIGIAYTPSFKSGVLGWLVGDRKSVVRSGYQIGYDSFFNNIASNAATSSPNVVSTQTVSTVNAANPRGLANLSAALPKTARALTPFDGQTLADPNLVNPYFQRWSLGVQRELPAQLMLDASYVGSKGTKLFMNEDANPLVPASLQVTPAGYTGTRSGRLDNLQGVRTVRANSGSSSYHAGQLMVSRRFARGFALTGGYTYAKLIDNNSEVFASAGLSNGSLSIIPHILGGERNERAVSLFDRTHRAVFTYVYDLPFMRDQRGALGRIVGGWQLSGITSFETGVPFTVTNGVDSNGVGGNNDRPDFNPFGQKGVRAVPNTASPTGYVNPDAANAPIDPKTAQFIGIAAGAGRTGTLGRNTQRTRGINNFDFTVQKQFRLTERTSLQFRTEFFNAFNHPQFGTLSISPFAPPTAGPSANVINTASGQFLQPQFGDGGGRVIRYLLKLT